MHDTAEARKLWKGKCAYNPWTHISHKELIYLLQKFISPRSKVLLRMLLGEGLVGVNHRVIPTSTHKESNKRTPYATNLSHNVNHTCMLRDLPTLTQVFLNFTITQLAHSNITTFISQNTYQVSNFSRYSMNSIWKFLLYSSWMPIILGLISHLKQITMLFKTLKII